MDTEKKQSYQISSQNTQLFQDSLINAIPSPVFYKNTDGIYVGCNEAFEKFTGKSRDEIMGKTVYDIAPKDLAERYHTADLQLFSNPQRQIYESQIKDAEGKYRSVIFNKDVIRDKDGKIAGLIGIIIDITEQKNIEHIIRLERDSAITITEATTPAEAFEKCIDSVIKIGDIDCAGIFLLDHESGALVLKCGKGVNKRFHERNNVFPTENPINEIVRQHKTIHTNYNMMTFSEETGYAEGLKAISIVPIIYRGKVIGCLNAASHTVDELSEQSKQALESFSAHIGSVFMRLKDEGKLRSKLVYEHAVSKVSEYLMKDTSPSGDVIIDVLNEMRDAASVSRVCVFKNFNDPEDGLCVKQVYEICAEKVKPEINSPDRQHMPYKDVLTRWQSILQNNGVISGNICDFPEQEKIPLSEHGITSILVLPLFVNNCWWGFIGFDHTTGKRQWTNSEISFLRTASEMIGNYMARKNAEEALFKSREQYMLAVNGSNDGIWDWDLETNDLFLSPKWKEMLGYKDDELPNEFFTFESRIHPEDKQNVKEYVDKYLSGEIDTYDITFRFRHRQGHYIWIQARGAALRNKNGKPYRMAGSHTNITEHKAMEERIRQMQKMDAIAQLAGGIAHDFNNQLGGIIGYANMLYKNITDEKLRRYINFILTGSRRASDLTRKLLAFARKGQYRNEPVDMHAIIEEVINMAGPALGKNISVKNFPEAKSFTVLGDPSQLQSAILNIVLNAKDAMPEGGEITMSTENAKITESYCKFADYEITPGQYLKVCITDNGCGISKENLPHIFEPFFTTKEVGKGSGMELAAVYGTIKNHKGAITVYSEEKYGTTFKLFIPLENSLIEQSEDTHETGSAELSKINILLVDDEEIICEYGRDILTSLGYNVIIRKDGRSALEYYQKNWQHINLVILDIVMPNMAGPETFRKMKTINHDIRALISSGYSLNGQAKNLMDEGVLGFLNKPFEDEELTALLSKCLPETEITEYKNEDMG